MNKSVDPQITSYTFHWKGANYMNQAEQFQMLVRMIIEIAYVTS